MTIDDCIDVCRLHRRSEFFEICMEGLKLLKILRCGMTDDMREAIWDREQARMIIESLDAGGSINLYASDGKGVRVVESLLSDSQKKEIEEKVVEFLLDLINDVNEMENDTV